MHQANFSNSVKLNCLCNQACLVSTRQPWTSAILPLEVANTEVPAFLWRQR